MSDLTELFEDPAVAGWVLGALVRDWTVQRRNGRPLPPNAVEVAVALQAAAGSDVDLERFARETTTASVGHMRVDRMTSAGVAAEACGVSGVSVQYVRRHAAGGDVRAERVGRDWRIDVDSLQNVLRRSA